MLDAAQIANLNVLRLINDTTAVALGYGITKSDLPEAENPRHVVFVDAGHTSLSVSIVAFSKGQLTVKATAYDRNVGGRDIDYALVQHFAEEFKTKYKIDVMANPKAMFRLTSGCDKLKKILSANAEAPLSVESIMVDVDASSRMTREEYEELIAPVVERITAPIQRALAESGLTLDQIDAIELIGGCTRIPAVRAKIQAVFEGKTLMTTLNQDEAIARGATFACAMLSPVFRVRDFSIHDITPYSIKVRWDKQPGDTDDDDELVVFPKGNSVPSTKVLTFYRKDTFDLEARYAEPEQLPGGINPWIARFTAKDVPPPQEGEGDLSVVKVKTRLSIHGVMSFEQAYVEVIEEKEDTAMAVDGEEPPKKKRVTRKKDVPFVWASTSLDPSVIEQYRQVEAEMHAADKLVVDTEVSTFSSRISGPSTHCYRYRTARTHSRNTSTTCAASSTAVTTPSPRPLRSRSSLLPSLLLRNGCTQTMARTRPSLSTSPSSTPSRCSATRSRSASRKQKTARRW